MIKNCNLLIPRTPLRTPKLQEKPSALKREHPALQKMKILFFFLFESGSYQPSAWIRRSRSGSGSTPKCPGSATLVATVLGAIPASVNTVESEGRQMKQCCTYLGVSIEVVLVPEEVLLVLRHLLGGEHGEAGHLPQAARPHVPAQPNIT